MILVHPVPLADRVDLYRRAARPQQVVFAKTAEEAVHTAAEARAFIGKVTPEILARANRMEWVQSPTASLEHYVFPELASHSCILTNVAGIFGDVISEHVLGYVLSFTRNLHLYRDRQHHSDARPVGAESLTPDFVAGPEAISGVDKCHSRIADHRFLLVGLGGIGSEIAAKLSVFGATVDAIEPRVASHADVGSIRGPAEMADCLSHYDFVIISAPHTPKTAGLFDASMIARMRRGAVLINVGRGAIVCHDAATHALASGHLGGIAFDVFEKEPLPAGSPLWQASNAIVTPHVAACCPVISERQGLLIADNIRRFVSGEPLRNVVDKDLWC